ncbi:MAG TPA: acyltransferase [Stellaceae bacterium]|jgi:peptidoglycan/LPS O-acetylase OafA/YrhL|nr:acyltransferase [Stellaceae bacterium]
MNRAINSLTALRGIAALLVLLYHVILTSPFSRGYLGVDLFFMLSGFVLMHTYGQRFGAGVRWPGYRDFLYARWSRIYPIHLLTLLLLLPLFGQGVRFSGSALLQNLLLTQGPWYTAGQSWNTSAWSLSVEWHAYLLFPLIAALTMRRGKIACGILGAICVLTLALLLKVSMGTVGGVISSVFVLVRGVPEFIIGMILYRFYADGAVRAHFEHDSACLACGVALIAFGTFGANDGPMLLALLGLLMTCAANRGRVARILCSRPLQYLGQISFSLYMIQLVFRTFLDNSRLLPLGGWRYDAVFVGGSFVLAMLISRYVEYPARDWLRGRWQGENSVLPTTLAIQPENAR